MGTELKLDIGTLYAFLLVLARVSGVFVFVPLPGIQAGPAIIRAALSASITLALMPLWPTIPSVGMSFGTLVGWLLAEAGLGIGVGIAVAFLAEIFQMGAQIISLQAGYSFASTIDPTSGADSSVLLAISQTAAGAGTLFVAILLTRIGDWRMAAILLAAGLALLLPHPASWLAFGIAWTAAGFLRTLEIMPRPRPSGAPHA